MEKFLPVKKKKEPINLAQYLAEKLPAYSLSSIRDFVEEGGVEVDGKIVSHGEYLEGGEVVEIIAPLPEADYRPREIDFEILYEDDELVVLSKPAGLPVIPTRDSTPTVIEALLHHGKGQFRPRIVHRLDMDTSGVLVVAKNREMAAALSQIFEDREVEKKYWAFVQGHPFPKEAEITEDVRDPHSGKEREALSRYRLLESYRFASLLEVDLITGRTHQIRIHLSGKGYPLLVDPQYGGREAIYLSEIKPRYRPKKGRPEPPLVDRLTLHARRLSLLHPGRGEKMTWTASLPKDLRRLKKKLSKHS